MIDIKHTDEGDIDLTTGDLIYIQATHQHQSDLLQSARGGWKEAPLFGVGLLDFLHEGNTSDALRTIRKNFEADKMKVKRLAIENGQIITIASYGND